MKPIRWGILGAGNIAGALAQALTQTSSGTALGVASRSLEKARAFAGRFGIPNAYGRYEDMLADPDIDAVYVTTPHPMHAEWAIKCAEAGKHILCEKPMTMNGADTMSVIAAARRHDVFLMEAFMYRCTPQTARLVELIRSGVIGRVCLIDATFGFKGEWNPAGRLFNPRLGGGAILDVGCYPMSMARLIAGAAQGRDLAEPIRINGLGHIGKTGVDEWATAELTFDGGILARLATSIRCALDNRVVIYGQDGQIEVPSPWFCQGREAGATLLRINGKEIQIRAKQGIYADEADTVSASLSARQAAGPAMSWTDSLGQARALDAWRSEIGLSYPCETAKAYARPLNRRPLKVHQPCRMRYGDIPGVGKPISRLVMGTMAPGSIGHASALYDDYYARGGNTWDTAYIYRDGNAERLLGQWVHSRRLREKVVVIVKGAHTPDCNPEALARQFHESLYRLGFDYADVYFMHRDNPDIPVGEFVDVMNHLKAKGLIRAFGGSNWSLKRVKAANAYARRNGASGFSAVSNHFSLAQWVQPLWGIRDASSQPDFRAWHEKTQNPCFAWSAQARGFFDPERAAPRKRNPDLEANWYSEENFRRQKRAIRLARQKGCHPMAIATAYGLAQAFPLFALVGPTTLDEAESTFRALDIELTAADVAWLDGRNTTARP